MIRNPPEQSYKQFSEALQSRLGTSIEEKLRSVLEAQELGERRPSQFLRHLQELTAPHLNDTESPLIRQIFMKAMPTSVSPFLQFLPPETDLHTLAGTADRVITTIPRPTVSAVSPTVKHLNGSTDIADTLATIMKRLDNLELKMKKLPSRSPSNLRRGRSNCRTLSRNAEKAQKSGSEICWYHSKYGQKARSCVPPCDCNHLN